MVGLIAFVLASVPDPAPIARGHSHNDYNRAHPLIESLEAGLCSVEVDIFLVDGQLLVGHNRNDLKAERTLDALYLKPMAKLARENDGRLYKGWPEVILLIDIKADGQKVFPVLIENLRRYKDVVGRDKPGAFRVVLSGDRPIALSYQDQNNWTAIDGRPSDLGKRIPIRRMPLVSDSWLSAIGSIKFDQMPQNAQTKFETLVTAAHREGRKIRFWAMPDSEPAWAFAWEGGVDLLNTDRPSDLAKWVKQRPSNNNRQ